MGTRRDRDSDKLILTQVSKNEVNAIEKLQKS